LGSIGESVDRALAGAADRLDVISQPVDRVARSGAKGESDEGGGSKQGAKHESSILLGQSEWVEAKHVFGKLTMR
jgi:hypothetical protein